MKIAKRAGHREWQTRTNVNVGTTFVVRGSFEGYLDAVESSSV